MSAVFVKWVANLIPPDTRAPRPRHPSDCYARLLILAVILAACRGTSSTPKLTPVTVQLRWTHQAQFAGFYAADQNKYYADEGLAVTFLEGGPTADLLAPLFTGSAQFSVAGADEVLVARSKGEPARAIATILRRSPIVFMALADSGITRPQDFVGKTIRVTTDTAVTFHAMMARAGISPDQWTEVNVPNDVTEFASGNIAVWSSFVSGFTITVEHAGYKVSFIYPDDYGVHLYADTIVTTDNLIAADPDLVRRFLRASLKGWTYAIENPTAVGPLVVTYNSAADPTLEIDKMVASLPLINTGEDHIGWMNPETWTGMEQLLREQGVLPGPVDVTQAYTLQFLKEIYP